jgi:hypothetical protein
VREAYVSNIEIQHWRGGRKRGVGLVGALRKSARKKRKRWMWRRRGSGSGSGWGKHIVELDLGRLMRKKMRMRMRMRRDCAPYLDIQIYVWSSSSSSCNDYKMVVFLSSLSWE